MAADSLCHMVFENINRSAYHPNGKPALGRLEDCRHNSHSYIGRRSYQASYEEKIQDILQRFLLPAVPYAPVPIYVDSRMDRNHVKLHVAPYSGPHRLIPHSENI